MVPDFVGDEKSGHRPQLRLSFANLAEVEVHDLERIRLAHLGTP
jgi:hypothetical protein